MSVEQQLRDSGLFYEAKPHKSGTVRFTVMGEDVPMKGASIYVLWNDTEVDIRVRALVQGRFPNNKELHLFLLDNAYRTVNAMEDRHNYCYSLKGEHIDGLIEIIRQGLEQ